MIAAAARNRERRAAVDDPWRRERRRGARPEGHSTEICVRGMFDARRFAGVSARFGVLERLSAAT